MVAVGAIVQNTKTKKILLIQRSLSLSFRPGVWEYPIGRMKQFEELEDALHRELKEEIGLKTFIIVKPINVFHFFRGERTAKNEVVGVVYLIKTETETITLSEEHDTYKWLTLQELKTCTLEDWVYKDLMLYINTQNM